MYIYNESTYLIIKEAVTFRMRGHCRSAIIVSKFPVTPTIIIKIVIHPVIMLEKKTKTTCVLGIEY